MRDALGGHFLQPFNDSRRALGGLGLDERMEVLRNQNPANQQKLQFLPHFFQSLHKTAAKTLREEQGRWAISAAGNELQFAAILGAMIERHAGEV